MKYINYIVILICAYFLYSCANVKAPEGGPRDRNPPKLVYIIPDTNQTNYNANTIKLTFDERIEIVNEKDIIIQPAVENYSVKYSNKTATLLFKDSLKPNTTYTIDFGKSIIDISERNIAENIFVSFSTGSSIDTNFINGKIVDKFTKKPIENAIIGLYKLEDTIQKVKPYYYNKSSKEGKYTLRNLKQGDYKLVIFEDKNNNLLAEIDKEKFSFIKNNLKLDSSLTNINLSISSPKPKFKIDEIKKFNTQTNIITTNVIRNYSIDGNTLLHNFNIGKCNEIIIYHTNKIEETVKLSISDSLGNKLDTIINILPISSIRKVKKVTNKIVSISESDSCIKIVYEKPIEKINKIAKLTITSKKIDYTEIDTIQIKKNSINLDSIITLKKSKIKIDTIVDSLIVDKTVNIVKLCTKLDSNNVIILNNKDIMFIDSTFNEYSLINYKSVVNKYYSSLEGNIIDSIPNRNYILQLLKDNKIKYEYISSNKEYSFDKVEEGEYSVRVIIDINDNKVFDYADYDKNIEAEEIFIDTKTIGVKRNWDQKDVLININSVDK